MRPQLNGGTLGRLNIAGLTACRRAAIRFWERGRIVYNLALLPAAAAGYLPRVSVCFGVGDDPHLSDSAILRLFIAYAVAANLCYTFAYVLEFFLASDDATTLWNRRGRLLAFLLGTLLSVIVAFFAAFGIALAQFPDNLAR